MTHGYPAARAIAGDVVTHLGAQRAQAAARGVRDFGPAPDATQVEALVDVAFWASLRREEGRAPQVSLAFLPPEAAGQAMRFTHPLPLEPRALTRLAPAVERPGIHLGIWPIDGELRVWGAARAIPTLTLVLEVVEPGLLVIKYRRADEFDKFGTIAVLEGDRVEIVDEMGASLPDCPELLSSLLGFELPATATGSSVLVQLAVSMRAHRRGGTLIVVPGDSDAWYASTAPSMPYRVAPYDALGALLGMPHADRHDPAWRESLRRAVDAIAGLTAVDGAVVIDARYRLLGFGVKLVRGPRSERVEQVRLTAPVVGNVAASVDPSRLGGTRHLSAAQFVHDQRDALALVASQDGRFTVMAWSPCECAVHAHRVEMLLM